MIDETIVEQQKHVRAILKRWKQFHSRHVLPFFSVASVGCAVVLYATITAFQSRLSLLLFLMLFLNGYLLPRYIVRTLIWSLHYVTSGPTLDKFIAQMTEYEHELLRNSDGVPLMATERENLRELRKVLSTDQLLRPSQRPQDETLLRAATSTDTTPQEQLLRPSQTTEE